MSQCIPAASVAYFKSVASGGKELGALTPELVAEIEELRESIRLSEGGGGMCHFVTEVLQNRYGWDRLFVSYLAPDGDIICGGGHVVNILPDGSVLDGTRDQFGEGHSVSLVPALSEEVGRYRPEFYQDFHPGHPDDTRGALDAWLPSYPGLEDADVQNALTEERGDGWWLADRTLLDAYRDRQKDYGRIYAAAHPSAKPIR